MVQFNSSLLTLPPCYQFDSQSLCDKVWLEFDEEIFINRGEETIDNNNGELF